MFQNAFAGRDKRPTQKELARALAQADNLWRDLIADLKRDLKLDNEEWNTSSVKAGWSLRLKLKKRNIVYLAPGAGCFQASFALGAKAVAVARNSKLSAHIVKMIDTAKQYPKGTGVRIEVRNARDAKLVETLAKIKVEN
jgi:hypothetical protein